MKSGLTEIIFVIDRSGSMSGIASDVIGGFNEFIKKQREVLEGKLCKVSAYKFDDVYETIFENVDLCNVNLLTSKDFEPRGSTALLDAVGRTIDNVGLRLYNTLEEDRPERVLIVVITDGRNNASVEYTIEQVKSKIEQQTQVYNWDFAYIGANQDAWAVGTGYNVAASSTLNYVADSLGVCDMFDKLDKSITSYRICSTKKSFNFETDK